MNRKIVIRNEEKSDRCKVEQLTRRAFYNIYVPGCSEHYLVHIMRDHEDFIPQLDFVLELDGEIIGNIMYTKAKLTDENGFEKNILTFGPVCIAPEYQRKGYGKESHQDGPDRPEPVTDITLSYHLAISKRIVCDSHHGELDSRSRPEGYDRQKDIIYDGR